MDATMTELTEPLKKSISNSAENNIHHKQRLYMERSSSHRERQRRREKSSGGCISQLVGVLHCYNVFLLDVFLLSSTVVVGTTNLGFVDWYLAGFWGKARQVAVTCAETECNRFLLDTLLAITWILGAGVLGLGIWLLVKDYSAREIAALIDSRLFEYVTYALVAGGGSVAVLAFCGCCGTMRQDKYVLGFYGTVLFIVLVVLVGGSVLAIIFRKKISLSLEKRFETTIEFNYGVDLIKNSDNRLITDAWDAMQRTLGCCGAHGDVYGRNSWATYKRESKWHNGQEDNRINGKRPYVPESCCVPGLSKNVCQGITSIHRRIPEYGPYDEGDDFVMNPNLYTTGCLDKAIEYLQKHSLYIAIVSGSVPVFLIAGIIISFYLCANVKSDEEDEEDDDDGQEAEV